MVGCHKYVGYLLHGSNEDDMDMAHCFFPQQCTDISVTPKNGTPPYTYEVRPIYLIIIV